jgi:hypothetical protein
MGPDGEPCTWLAYKFPFENTSGQIEGNRDRHSRAQEGKGIAADIDGAADPCAGGRTRAHLAGVTR